MAGEYGVGIAYKGLTMHKEKRWHTVTGKGLCAVMWFWVLYRAKQDDPLLLAGLVSLSSFKESLTFSIHSLSWYFLQGWRHPWEGHDDHGHGHGH